MSLWMIISWQIRLFRNVMFFFLRKIAYPNTERQGSVWKGGTLRTLAFKKSKLTAPNPKVLRMATRRPKLVKWSKNSDEPFNSKCWICGCKFFRKYPITTWGDEDYGAYWGCNISYNYRDFLPFLGASHSHPLQPKLCQATSTTARQCITNHKVSVW